MATAERFHLTEFTNEAFVDFSRPENKSQMEAALAKVKAEFGKEYPMYIGGEKVYTTGKMSSTNPSHPSEVIGVFQAGTKDNADAAVAALCSERSDNLHLDLESGSKLRLTPD